MTHPHKVKLFRPWAAAMIEGATVGNPDYGKRSSSLKSPRKRRRKKPKRRRKKTKDG